MGTASTLRIRDAVPADLPAIIDLLADDVLGRAREAATVDPAYARAFHAIEQDPNHRLLVAEQDERIVGCFQLTYLPGLSRGGAWRAQIESVRIAAPVRGGGIGATMMRWAVERARERGCALVQLTTDKRRPDAHRFYRRLGFEASHEGMKLMLR